MLAELGEPMEEHEADLTAKVLGTSMVNLVGMVGDLRRQTTRLTNTDGDPMELLTATEAATSMAQLAEEATREGWGPVAEPEGPRRRLRGTVHFEPGRVRVEVSSRRRLEVVGAALRRAGVRGDLQVERAIDPALDLPTPGGRLRGGRAQSAAVEAAWRERWLDEPLPALGGKSPRAASGDPERLVLLESLLRQFEHDADEDDGAGDEDEDEGLRASSPTARPGP